MHGSKRSTSRLLDTKIPKQGSHHSLVLSRVKDGCFVWKRGKTPSAWLWIFGNCGRPQQGGPMAGSGLCKPAPLGCWAWKQRHAAPRAAATRATRGRRLLRRVLAPVAVPVAPSAELKVLQQRQVPSVPRDENSNFARHCAAHLAPFSHFAFHPRAALVELLAR